MKVIALDPGGTTGWAMYTGSAATSNAWTCGQLGPNDHHRKLYALLEREHSCVDYSVVCESFEFRQGRQRDNINLMSKEYIGLVKYFGQERDVSVVFQTAAMGKGFVTDNKIRAMGLWVPGQKHAMDAMRHLITYLVNKRHRTDLIESWKNL